MKLSRAFSAQHKESFDDQAPAPLFLNQVPCGSYTQCVYSLIRDERFTDVITLLSNELSKRPSSRPAISLLAYCFYCIQDWVAAASCYEELLTLCPENNDYKLYYANSLFKSGQGSKAFAATLSITDSLYLDKVRRVQAAIKYESQDYAACKALIEKSSPEDVDTLFNKGCLLYKQGKYAEAMTKFQTAAKRTSFDAEIQYCIALCNYQTKDYVQSLKCLGDIIETGIKEYPDLNVGVSPGEILSVANSPALHKSYLVEAFNLKASIEYNLKNFSAAKEALQDMPPRIEEELDPVTLHNQALVYMESDPSAAFEKMIFLLQQVPCPPETFGNIILLYLKFEYYDAAADLLAENEDMARVVLSKYIYDLFSAILLRSASKEDSFKKLDEIGLKHVEQLRKLSKKVQEARANHEDDEAKHFVCEYDEVLEKYIPVLMSQAKLYWDTKEYHIVEKIFRKSVEFCSEHEAWKLNVAHVLFMQETKYKEAISFYEPLVQSQFEKMGLLEITPIVLGNLCASYIMSSQNEDAEELMRRIEKEEELQAAETPNKNCYHLCIVNLVIGTLYCSKGNFEFGIGRIIKSMDPVPRKLSTDTWYYASRCFAALFETLAKQMITLKEEVYSDILVFMDACDTHGRDIPAVVDPMGVANTDPGQNSVAYEARQFKALFLKLYD